VAKKGLHVKKGDTVMVISGADRSYADRLRRGEVLEASPETDRVVVQGTNMQIKHQRRTQKSPQGGRAQRPGPMAASNVMLVCPSCDQPTRTRKRVREGTRVRVCRKCDKDID